MVKISEIVPGSIADSLDLQVGDGFITINRRPVLDFLDVLLAEKEQSLTVEIEKENGEIWQLDIDKETNDSIGVALEHPEPSHCGNNCIFCFVHQLPKGMRRTLYVKDEDYRYSYLYGSYITLTNLTEEDLSRIVEQKLSPLYISVHATDESLRSRILGKPVPAIMPILQRLVEAGIELHTQIVVCPEINDGDALKASVEQLASLSPGIRTLALVPVGLTEHRHQLTKLRLSTGEEAEILLASVARWQEHYLKISDSRFVFAADEFYLKAGKEFPELSAYEDLAQLENGVGMIPVFRDEAQEAMTEADSLSCPVEFSIVTGQAFGPELKTFLDALAAKTDCVAHLHVIENRFFGPSVSVAGLLTGKDIVDQLSGKKLGSVLLIPDVMMRDGENLFLDGVTPTQVEDQLACKVIVFSARPLGLLESIEALVP